MARKRERQRELERVQEVSGGERGGGPRRER